MGKGSQNTSESVTAIQPSEGCAVLDRTENIYSREQVSKHNKRGDIWIIINDNVYDLSKFQKIHPGGSKILAIYAGQDATVSLF
jgi:cytochrome b involved in lipid metabolism